MANNDRTVFNKNMIIIIIIIIIIMTIMMMMMTMIIIAMINNNDNDKFSDLQNLTPLFSGSSMFRHILGKFGDNWLSWL